MIFYEFKNLFIDLWTNNPAFMHIMHITLCDSQINYDFLEHNYNTPKNIDRALEYVKRDYDTFCQVIAAYNTKIEK